jgi:hypothetical protein
MGAKQSLKATVHPQSHQRQGTIDFHDGTRFPITYSTTARACQDFCFSSIYRGRLYNMYSSFLLTLLLQFAFSTPAFGQYYTTSAAAATSSLTPAEMAAAASVSSVFASLATATPQQQSGDGGGPGDASSSGGSGNAAGASGSDTSSFSLSKGGLIAIIVVVVIVAIFGSTYPSKEYGMILLTRLSCFNGALLSCKEEILGSSGNY